MFYVLPLELLALCVVRPREPLVEVQRSVEATGDKNETPADRFE